MVRLIITFLVLSSLSQLTFAIHEQNIQIFYPAVKVEERKGIVLIFHGLNLKPSKMDEISSTLQKEGFVVIRPKFKAHQNIPFEMEKIKLLDWSNDALFFLKESLKIADKEKLKINFLGYSMGALFFIDAFSKLSTEERKAFKKSIFLAPAISFRFYADLVKLFYIFGDDFILNSKNPEEYRENPGTSMGGYKAIFFTANEIDKFKESDFISNSLIFVHPNDELITPSGIEDFIYEHNLKGWKIELLKSKGFGPNHLIVDKKSLGELAFQEMMDRIITKFKED